MLYITNFFWNFQTRNSLVGVLVTVKLSRLKVNIGVLHKSEMIMQIYMAVACYSVILGC
jgi:hypothetical protein